MQIQQLCQDQNQNVEEVQGFLAQWKNIWQNLSGSIFATRKKDDTFQRLQPCYLKNENNSPKLVLCLNTKITIPNLYIQCIG